MAKREEWINKKRTITGYYKLSKIIPDVTKEAFKDKGTLEAKIISNWHNIVGRDLATDTFPKKLTFSRDENKAATLHLDVYGGNVMEIQYMESNIIDKISTYLGYAAVAKIKFFQKPFEDKVEIEKEEVVRNKSEDRDLSKVKDDDLQRALNNLATNI